MSCVSTLSRCEYIFSLFEWQANVVFAETFKALSDPVRRDILTLLKEGSMSAGDIAAQFDMTAATISYHLKILKKSGLVCETKEKN